MKKIYLLIILIFLCTGCSAIKYKINFSEQISEDITTINDEIYDNPFKDDSEGYIITPFEKFFSDTKYDFIGDINGNGYASSNFESIDSFINNSVVFNKLFDKNVIKKNKSKIHINIDAKKYQYIVDKLKNINKIEISADIPYYVSSHNATKVDGNTYTWIIDDIDNARIKINFDMSKKYNYVDNTFSIIVIIGFSVIIFGVIIFFVIKNKKANEI